MASSEEEITTLTFTPDNCCNTVITSSSGEVLYRVATDAAVKHPVTLVHDGAGELVASLEWHDVSSDKVVLKGQKPVSFNDWVKKNHIPFTESALFSATATDVSPLPLPSEASFKDSQGRKYKWKGIGPGGRYMELHAEDDHFKTVIARYTRSYRMPNPAGADAPVLRTPGELRLTARAAAVQQLVVLTLLFQEKQRRLDTGDLGQGASVGLELGVGPVAGAAGVLG